jgi:phosphate transport system protein
MERHFDQQLAELKEALLKMAGIATESVAAALKALVQRDDSLARLVEENDTILDKMEVEVDDRCMKLLALRQPIATDLRFITMAMRISSDLERIGDQAVSISNRAISLNKEPLLKPLVDIPRMADHVMGMIRDALDAFVYAQPDKAREVIARDKKVDDLNDQLHRELTSFMIENPNTISRALNLMTVSRKLERIGDHATSIAEEIIYLYEAKDIRHQH